MRPLSDIAQNAQEILAPHEDFESSRAERAARDCLELIAWIEANRTCDSCEHYAAPLVCNQCRGTYRNWTPRAGR